MFAVWDTAYEDSRPRDLDRYAVLEAKITSYVWTPESGESYTS
jgi:hypothetical protein